jgi:hypothetical protein
VKLERTLSARRVTLATLAFFFPLPSRLFPKRKCHAKNLHRPTLKKPSKNALSIPLGFGFTFKTNAISSLQAKRF